LYLFFLTLSDLFKNKLLNISQNISHFGFSVLILSILFNNIFSSEIITNMKIGEVYKKDQIEISFQNIEQKKEKNFNSIIGTFNITDSENKSIILKPQLRIFNQPNIITSEADIKTTLFSDKFMVMNVVQNQEYFNVRYQIKPFMVWIWISVIIISLGGLVSFYRKI
jgi:cytochrome c-type biogenesis protein CcmF